MQNTKLVPTPEMIRSAYNVFKCIAYVEAIRPEVESYHQKVINDMKPINKRTGEIITSIKDEHRMDKDSYKQYSKRLNPEARKAGFNVKPGYCPLLIAEEDLRQAKRHLINAMELITEVPYQMLVTRGLEYYDEMVELTLKFLSPFVDDYHKSVS